MCAQRLSRLVKKLAALLLLGFVALVAARFVYSYRLPVGELADPRRAIKQEISDLGSIKYRSSNSNNLLTIAPSAEAFFAQGNIALLQVFEKTGQLQSATTDFDGDRAKLLAVLNDKKTIVKYERTRGLSPRRSIHVALAVKDDAFDGVMEGLKVIGELRFAQVTKADRTQEFRSLFAQKESLQKHLQALTRLRESKAKVDEFINLEGKILELQKQVHTLQIRLGDFATEESFSNIAFSLSETGQGAAYTNALRLVDAFIWSLARYCYVVFAGVIVYLCVLSVGVLRE